MAGTDRSQALLPGTATDDRIVGPNGPAGGPVIVLVRPQLGENIGTAARAMLNCGLTRLRLVAPRDGWPSAKAEMAASGALETVDVELFAETATAVADLQQVYASTARSREQIKPVVTPAAAVEDGRRLMAAGARVGILFGPERSGLINDDIALADAILKIPLNPSFASLNLAQAVLLVAHAWFSATDTTPDRYLTEGVEGRATRGNLLGFFERLEMALDGCGFLALPDKRPTMIRNIRNIFQRADLMETEVRTLHGILTCLVTRGRAHHLRPPSVDNGK